ncbi:Tn3 family transposase [Saccharopolyspora sp. ASAGF58]|uniref:Tn3 family transposase n=1 Tax=Saccharopolyspora sp. ASAGF58 TaxID=2719023 RepID=UPI0035302A95
MLPRVDLPEVLLQVFSWTGAADAFTSITGGKARLADLHITIAALLVAESCNIGWPPSAPGPAHGGDGHAPDQDPPERPQGPSVPQATAAARPGAQRAQPRPAHPRVDQVIPRYRARAFEPSCCGA